MSLSSLTNNLSVADRLRKAVGSDTVSHAYLFAGRRDARRSMALEFAKAILCPESPDDSCGQCRICRKVDHENHEDLLWVQKDGNSIRKEAVEDIIAALSFKSFGSRNVVVMDDAGTMTTAAANKLLKTLEEPSGPAVILLLAERKEALPETILSRCVTYQLREEDTAADEETASAARRWIALWAAEAPFYKGAELTAPFLGQRDRCLVLLDELEDQLRELLLSASGAGALAGKAGRDTLREQGLPTGAGHAQQAIAEVEAARKSLNLGYQTGYTMKNLCLRTYRRRDLEE